ncbi:GDP-L-fucose synthase family protein [Campylobacter jejuni]|uniref:GDP-L-fucose synthase family protein n=1 Tax=Campylobacter jejuni TaxID=197 RepID=UPI0005CEAEE8|nr:GDP-L-fucose synthase [Campylobacter jejuni]KJD22557.1 GDP-4-keto-6-deoxy-D-mannose-3, 5-epimerase-4-reductase [Campylobacter jejuni subsp. jejuni]KJD99288.1 GDP-4-keto-6-deoxy-D-mannose-3, 5-epimerase-4-reductase [Campylobacter jejuni subsp. jejuni]
MLKNSKIYIAGHTGLIGSAILKKLYDQGYQNIVYRTHKELDLLDQYAVKRFFELEKPEYVFFCAAKVGGMISQLKQRASFLYENLMMQNNVIHFSYLNGVKKLLYLGSICIYPQDAKLPIKEDDLFDGKLQYNNEPYAIAKIAGLKMCEFYSFQYDLDYIPIMPVSIYGSNDNFDIETAHVQAAIFRKIYLAKLLNEKRFQELISNLNMKNKEDALNYLKTLNINELSVQLLGTGNSRREFLHCDDLADASLYLMNSISFKDIIQKQGNKIANSHINIGTGKDISIKELAFLIADILDYKGEVKFENKKENDGTLRKVVDIKKMEKLGWKYKIDLQEGLSKMCYDYIKEKENK